MFCDADCFFLFWTNLNIDLGEFALQFVNYAVYLLLMVESFKILVEP